MEGNFFSESYHCQKTGPGNALTTKSKVPSPARAGQVPRALSGLL